MSQMCSVREAEIDRLQAKIDDLEHYTSNFCDWVAADGISAGSRCTLPKGHDGAHVYGCLHPALDTHDAMLGGYAAIREEEKAKRMECVAKLEKAAFLLSVCSCYELGAIRDEVRQAVVEIIAIIGRKENK